MIDWIVPALLSPLIFAIVTLIDKRVLSDFRIPLPSFNLFVGGSQGTFGLLIIVFNPLPDVSASIILGGLTVGALQGMGLVVMFWMLNREDPSRVVPAMQTSPIIVALLAWPIFGEALSALQWFAVFMAVGAAFLVSINVNADGGSPRFRPIYLILIFSALTMATSQLLLKSITEDLSTTHTVALRGMGLFIVMWIIFARPESIRGLVRFLKDPHLATWLIVSEAIMPFTGHLLIVTAISRGPVSLVAAVWGTRPVWVFLLSLTLSRVAPRLIYETFSRKELPLKFGASAMVAVAIGLIALA